MFSSVQIPTVDGILYIEGDEKSRVKEAQNWRTVRMVRFSLEEYQWRTVRMTWLMAITKIHGILYGIASRPMWYRG